MSATLLLCESTGSIAFLVFSVFATAFKITVIA